MKLRHFFPRLILDFFVILVLLMPLTTMLYDALKPVLPGYWAEGIASTLGLLAAVFIVADLLRIFLRVERSIYPSFLEVTDPIAGSYNQLIPTQNYAIALECVAAAHHKNLTSEETGTFTERAVNLWEKIKNITSTSSKIKALRDNATVQVTNDSVGALGALNFSRYLQLSKTNLLPLRALPFHRLTTGEETHAWVITADDAELRGAYNRFKIPHSTYYNFSDHAPGDIPVWLRWMLPDMNTYTTLRPQIALDNACAPAPSETPNLNAYPQTPWQETATYALALAAHAARWGTPRATIIDLLDAYTARQNFIIADKVLTSEQIYAWARAELFSAHDAEYTPNPPALPGIVREAVPGELVMPGA